MKNLILLRNKVEDIKVSNSKCQKAMKKITNVFKEIIEDDMELAILFNEHDDNIAGSEDEITLFIKDKKTKEHRGINLTYYFEQWNNENKEGF